MYYHTYIWTMYLINSPIQTALNWLSCVWVIFSLTSGHAGWGSSVKRVSASTRLGAYDNIMVNRLTVQNYLSRNQPKVLNATKNITFQNKNNNKHTSGTCMSFEVLMSVRPLRLAFPLIFTVLHAMKQTLRCQVFVSTLFLSVVTYLDATALLKALVLLYSYHVHNRYL